MWSALKAKVKQLMTVDDGKKSNDEQMCAGKQTVITLKLISVLHKTKTLQKAAFKLAN